MNDKELLERLKAYFTVHFIGSVSEGGCETCGYGGREGMTLKDIRDTIDKFLEAECKP